MFVIESILHHGAKAVLFCL